MIAKKSKTMEASGQETEVLTVGHSILPYGDFLGLIRRANVTAIADVRSSPHSSRFPQFDRDSLSCDLRRDGIVYVFLGRELGGRPSGHQLYRNGVADYERMSQRGEFEKGLDRVIEGARKHRIALMCSEHNPLECHRCLLVGRALAERGVRVNHILDDGRIVGHSEIEERLLALSGRSEDDLFASRSERLALAYREQSRKVAFNEPHANTGGSIAAE